MQEKTGNILGGTSSGMASHCPQNSSSRYTGGHRGHAGRGHEQAEGEIKWEMCLLRWFILVYMYVAPLTEKTHFNVLVLIVLLSSLQFEQLDCLKCFH